MKLPIAISILLLSTVSAFSQNRPSTLTVDFGYHYSEFEMGDLNQLFIEDFAVRNDLLETGIYDGKEYLANSVHVWAISFSQLKP